MNNQTIIQQLREGKNREALKCLYEAFPSARSFVQMHGGDDDDARDVFQESLIVLYRNTLNPDFQLTCAVSTYLISIVKYKWKDELKRKNRIVQFEIDLPDTTEDLRFAQKQERRLQTVEKVLARLGDKCRELLTLFYYQKKSMDEISAELGYRNTDTVKTQKYKCLERAKIMARELIYSPSTTES